MTRGVLFVLPVAPRGWRGPVAPWITTAGWADAARRVVGDAWVVTPHGVLDPESVWAEASRPSLASRPPAWWRGLVPELAVTLAKDARSAVHGRRFAGAIADGPWRNDDADVAFVWQRHDLFNHAGLRAARSLQRPLVTFAAAPLVWEARRWGVRRPGWGRVVERLGEVKPLAAADVVACTSDEVADELARLGVPAAKLLVTPAGVDIARFTPETSGAGVRERYGIGEAPVIGWTGSFRRLHGLDSILRAVAKVNATHDDVVLLLVGDGNERPRLEGLAADLGVRTVFTGTVPHREMPEHVAAMDIAVVSGSDEFHYSPLKLSEYLAAGRAVVGPRVGHVERLLTDGRDGVLVPTGDGDAMADALASLLDDPAGRARMGQAGRETAVARCSWDQRVQLVLGRLGLPR